jgi:hypothetical protein
MCVKTTQQAMRSFHLLRTEMRDLPKFSLLMARGRERYRLGENPDIWPEEKVSELLGDMFCCPELTNLQAEDT